MATALFFMLAGFLLGFVLREALIRVERSTPSPLPRSRPGTSQVSEPARTASSHPSNVRIVPVDTPPHLRREITYRGRPLFPNYAERYAQECREVGQDEVIRRHSR